MRKVLVLSLLCGASVLAAASDSATVRLRQNEVIPVVMQEALTIEGSRKGDLFTAVATESDRLPYGTRFLGRVLAVHPAREDRAATIDLEFTRIDFLRGENHVLSAVPIPLTKDYVVRDAKGRFVAKKEVRKKENYVLGGAVGGLLLGGILRKPVEGLVIGTLGGIALAETDKKNDGNHVIAKGQRLGALVREDVELTVKSADFDRREGVDRDDDARDDRDIDIQVGGRRLDFGRDARPYRLGSSVMVPLETIADQLRLDVDRAGSRRVYVEAGDQTLRMELGSREYRLNGRTGTFARTVTERDGHLYVPLEAISLLKRDRILINGNPTDGREYQ